MKKHPGYDETTARKVMPFDQMVMMNAMAPHLLAIQQLTGNLPFSVIFDLGDGKSTFIMGVGTDGEGAYELARACVKAADIEKAVAEKAGKTAQ